MQRLFGFQQPDFYRGGFVAIGNFDGVHLGHRKMVETLVQRARQAEAPAVVLTFDPHPVEILRPEKAPARLITLEGKTELLEKLGVDCLIVYPTDRALLNLSPDEFFRRIIAGELNARGLVEGENFCFGKDRSGDVATLEILCKRSNRTLEIVSPVRLGGQIVSSSRIREKIAAGDLAGAVELLGHPYRLQGSVARGSGRGRELGFPTANLENIETLIPADGVYAAVAEIPGNRFAAAVSIGPNPTFGEPERKVEVHLLDFSGDLYGRPINVDLVEQIRRQQKFSDAEALKTQLADDIKQVRAAAGRILHFRDNSYGH